MQRILLIEENEVYRRLLKQHINVIDPLAQVVDHCPVRDGLLPYEFAGSSYDYVVLGSLADPSQGPRWLDDLTRRVNFPPVIYVTDIKAIDQLPAPAESRALGVLYKDKIDHSRLRELMHQAHERRRAEIRRQRQSPNGDRLYRFGDVLIRGERCIRQLAVSALSKVYLAESEKVGRLVVLKIFAHVPDVAEKHATFDRFLQEYQIIAGINHPNVVRIYDLGVADDHAYITMEYFPAGDLRARIRRGMDPGQAPQIVRQMAQALAAVHEAGVLHRDLKPGNVMLRQDGTIVLIDFGLAKQVALEAEITANGEIFGTPYYMSPEQGHGREVEKSSDIYSLGVIFYEMLTGQKPFVASTPMAVIYKHTHDPIPQLPAEQAHWQPMLELMLAKNPKDRYADALQVVEALDRVLALPVGPQTPAIAGNV